MNSTYHTTYQYHFCLGENLLRGDGAQSCLSVCHQSSLSSPLSSPLLYWLRHQCWQIIQSGDDAAFRQSVIFPNNCANKPSLSALSCSLQPDPSNQVMWLTSPTIYRHVSVRIIFRLSAVYTGSAWCEYWTWFGWDHSKTQQQPELTDKALCRPTKNDIVDDALSDDWVTEGCEDPWWTGQQRKGNGHLTGMMSIIAPVKMKRK